MSQCAVARAYSVAQRHVVRSIPTSWVPSVDRASNSAQLGTCGDGHWSPSQMATMCACVRWTRSCLSSTPPGCPKCASQITDCVVCATMHQVLDPQAQSQFQPQPRRPRKHKAIAANCMSGTASVCREECLQCDLTDVYAVCRCRATALCHVLAAAVARASHHTSVQILCAVAERLRASDALAHALLLTCPVFVCMEHHQPVHAWS